MSIVPPTPPLVLELAENGPYGELRIEGMAWKPEEGAALVRHYVHLLSQRTPEANDAWVALHIAVGEAGLRRHTPPDAPIACKKGCSYCCHQHVSVTAMEIFYIARKLRVSSDLEMFTAKLDAKAANKDWDPTRDFDVRNPCAFLVAGACGIHKFRAMICRLVVSLDAGACLKQLVNGTGQTPHPRSIILMRNWLNPAIYSACQASHLPVRDYELTASVRAVLADPGIEARWYAGIDDLEVYSSDDEKAGGAMLDEIAHWRAMAGV
ncbi:MAG: YkgJ family cysteine cluster protein [Sphingomonadaceae bacterium]